MPMPSFSKCLPLFSLDWDQQSVQLAWRSPNAETLGFHIEAVPEAFPTDWLWRDDPASQAWLRSLIHDHVPQGGLVMALPSADLFHHWVETEQSLLGESSKDWSQITQSAIAQAPELSHHQLVFDVLPVGHWRRDGSLPDEQSMSRWWVVGVPEAIIHQHLRLARQLDVRLVSLNIRLAALLEVHHQGHWARGCHALINRHGECTEVAIICDQIVEWMTHFSTDRLSAAEHHQHVISELHRAQSAWAFRQIWLAGSVDSDMMSRITASFDLPVRPLNEEATDLDVSRGLLASLTRHH